ncbi:MAG: hypothetical protein K2I77_04425 [Anaeroplasmataceae bacterium]|nr:hypothetical protein [Anaeroplasmataceae bacterium]
MTTNKKSELENSFWIEYKEELIEELNFRLVLNWLESGYPLIDTIFIVESIEFKGIESCKKKKSFWDFIKRLFKKKRKKE